jgi:hypothetical protein
MGALPQDLEIVFEVRRKTSNEKIEIVFEVRRKTSNEKITRKKEAFQLTKHIFILFWTLPTFKSHNSFISYLFQKI